MEDRIVIRVYHVLDEKCCIERHHVDTFAELPGVIETIKEHAGSTCTIKITFERIKDDAHHQPEASQLLTDGCGNH